MKKVLAVLRGLGIYCVFLLLPAALWILAQLFLPGHLDGILLFLETFSTILTALILLGLYALRGGSLRSSVGLAPREAPVSVHAAAFALGLFGNGAVSFLMNFLPAGWLASYAEQSAAAYNPEQSLLSILAIVLLAPVGEELIFRGMICRSFQEAMPAWLAAAASALLFGAAHLHPVWVCYAFAMGFCFAVMVQRTGTLSISILAHLGFNLASLPSLLLPEDAFFVQLIYGSGIRYLIFGVLCIAVCVWLWKRCFSRRCPWCGDAR